MASSEKLVLGVGNEHGTIGFYVPSATLTELAANKAYLNVSDIPAASPAIAMNFGGEATGIGAVLGEEGVFFCSGVLIPFNIFAFTHGVRLISGKSTEKTGFKMKWLFLNPGVISVLIGLPLFLLNVTLPRILAEPVSYIASLNTPLAMLMFGTYLAQTDLRKMFLRKETYLVALLKLIAVPSAMLLVMRLCGITGVLCTALIISASAPTANNTVMFATKYGRDTAAASQTVAVVSFLSVLTMPLFIAIAQL